MNNKRSKITKIFPVVIVQMLVLGLVFVKSTLAAGGPTNPPTNNPIYNTGLEDIDLNTVAVSGAVTLGVGLAVLVNSKLLISVLQKK